MEKGNAHRPIKNNDDWLAAASTYYTDLMVRYVCDHPMSLRERWIIDGISAKIGRKPETAKHYQARLVAEGIEQIHNGSSDDYPRQVEGSVWD